MVEGLTWQATRLDPGNAARPPRGGAGIPASPASGNDAQGSSKAVVLYNLRGRWHDATEPAFAEESKSFPPQILTGALLNVWLLQKLSSNTTP
jgi:hypothetical protein